jgi:hypothetical protein
MFAVGALVLGGCEEEQKKTTSDKGADAEAPGPAVDPNLAQAMASAAQASRGAAPMPTATGDGPPPSGIFETAKADEILKKGAPPKIELGGAGNAPKSVQRRPVAPGWKQTGAVSLSLRAGQRMLPPLEMAVSLEAQKPRPAKPGETAAAGVPVVAKVTSAKMGELQGQAAPPELTVQIAKLKGSRIELTVLPSGLASAQGYELAKGADEGLNTVVRALGETLALAFVPFPEEPVGAGGYWLTTSREFASGADVLSYRLAKLESVNDKSAELNVTTKRYATANRLTLAGLPPNMTLEQFQAEVTGQMTLAKGRVLPSTATLKHTLDATLIPPDNPGQRAQAQSLVDATLAFGKPAE